MTDTNTDIAADPAAQAAATKKIINRLRRAQGQLNAVLTAVEAGADCRSVVTQLAAVSSALDRAGFTIISTAMRECLTTSPGGGNEDGNTLTVEELEKIFLTLA
jgi:DNA-binding FrmR family transcriptional regulator